jgi:hypothetical protein
VGLLEATPRLEQGRTLKRSGLVRTALELGTGLGLRLVWELVKGDLIR